MVASHREPAVPADAWITLTDNGPSAMSVFIQYDKYGSEDL